jgi:hypothetical protein
MSAFVQNFTASVQKNFGFETIQHIWGERKNIEKKINSQLLTMQPVDSNWKNWNTFNAWIEKKLSQANKTHTSNILWHLNCI